MKISRRAVMQFEEGRACGTWIELIEERPEAGRPLAGRTFARRLALNSQPPAALSSPGGDRSSFFD
jgi:hypothetical protein